MGYAPRAVFESLLPHKTVNAIFDFVIINSKLTICAQVSFVVGEIAKKQGVGY